SRDDDDRNPTRCWILLELPADVVTAQYREFEIEKNQVGREVGDTVQRLDAIAGDRDFVTFCNKYLLKKARGSAVVVYHQDSVGRPFNHPSVPLRLGLLSARIPWRSWTLCPPERKGDRGGEA